MSHQLTFADSEFSTKRRQTRKEIFLSRMEQILPWQNMTAVIEPFYPKAGNADPISAQVSGSVTVVNHKDTNYVRQGDILVSLDKTDATIALNKAKNNLANIVRQTNKLYLQDKQYSAEVASARIQ
ncbi:biotin/lipoyl-binding protein, partial [Escherichia coli]|uniref:biotin/lipoyl-binding protein n=1 Tax=Escherichia coli TaxID=562 RepID=UPI000A5550D0